MLLCTDNLADVSVVASHIFESMKKAVINSPLMKGRVNRHIQVQLYRWHAH